MTTWRRARAALAELMQARAKPLAEFQAEIGREEPVRVPGGAVFMTTNPDTVPPVLLHHIRHNKVLHETVVILVIVSENVPEVPESRRVEIRDLGKGLYHATAHYGFMQSPDVPGILLACGHRGLALPDGDDTTFYLGRETLLPTGRARLARWRKRLFMFLARNARSPADYFGIPPDRVVEIGIRIEL